MKTDTANLIFKDAVKNNPHGIDFRIDGTGRLFFCTGEGNYIKEWHLFEGKNVRSARAKMAYLLKKYGYHLTGWRSWYFGKDGIQHGYKAWINYGKVENA